MLSYSQVSLYLQCPRKWYWRYSEGWGLKKVPLDLLLGGGFHRMVARYLENGEMSESVSGISGGNMATLRRWFEGWCMDPVVQTMEVLFVEEELTAGQFRGVIDCIAILAGGQRVVIDWKTSGTLYAPHQVWMSDQLTAYAWLCAANGLPVDNVAYCVLLKGSGEIQWGVAVRTEHDIREYEKTVRWVAAQIARGVVHKSESWQCGRCEYLPLCLGEVDPEHLVRRERR